MEKPTHYYIGYEDSQRYQHALAQAGGDPDAVDPVALWTTENAKTLREAKRLSKRRSLEFGVPVTVYERVSVVTSHPSSSEAPGHPQWEWDFVSVGGYAGGHWEKY